MREQKKQHEIENGNHFGGGVQPMPLGYFDLHCHLLFGIDDGAASLEESVRAVQMAWAEGIRHIVFTPHYTPGSGAVKKEEIARRIETVKEAAKQAGIKEMRYYCGSEVLYVSGVEELLKREEISTIADTSYVLLEFYQGVRYQDMFQGLSRVVRTGFIPVLAHVERYDCLYQRLERIEELRDLGIVIQMNTECLIKRVPDIRTHWYRKVMKAGYIHLIATDAHGADRKPPRFKRAVEWLNRHCDQGLAERMLYENPERVLEGRIL